MWPRLWRLWQEPKPNTMWTDRREYEEVWVWYVTGNPEDRYVVVCRRRTGVDDEGGTDWAREGLVSMSRWRREWVWMREVTA
jgi:hypothetical protein